MNWKEFLERVQTHEANASECRACRSSTTCHEIGRKITPFPRARLRFNQVWFRILEFVYRRGSKWRKRSRNGEDWKRKGRGIIDFSGRTVELTHGSDVHTKLYRFATKLDALLHLINQLKRKKFTRKWISLVSGMKFEIDMLRNGYIWGNVSWLYTFYDFGGNTK